MIFPFCYVCPRDWELFEMLVRSWERIGRQESWAAFHDRQEPLTAAQRGFCEEHQVGIFERPDGFHPWSGWPHAMSKFHGWAKMLEGGDLKDFDRILYVDSDCCFFTVDILHEVNRADFVGFGHDHKVYVNSLGRNWSWLSGCFQSASVAAVRRMIAMTPEQLQEARAEMLTYDFSHNEDVVISFLMAKSGASEHRINGAVYSESDPQTALAGAKTPNSFVHLNGNPETWMGRKISGKWDIPRVVREVGGIFP